MSNPISDLRDFLSMSPSVVFPQDVLEYLPAIESENAKLRKLIQDLDECASNVPPCDSGCAHWDGGACDCSLHILDRVRELEMEVPM